MNLVDRYVISKAFGIGKVVFQTEVSIVVEFDCGQKKFEYPKAFEKFLVCEDDEMQRIIEQEIKSNKELYEIKKEAEHKVIVEKKIEYKQKKTNSKNNVAFKCNFCDGGTSEQHVGFRGPCSDGVIRNNIDIEKRTWCSSDSSLCNKYWTSNMSRSQFEKEAAVEQFLCYESKMLVEWKAQGGIVQRGENKGKPMKVKNVKRGSLCVLTTRDPGSIEEDRYIFGVFVVDSTYEGDNRTEGFVTTNSEYKLELSPKEARQMLFWNYYFNENKEEKIVWGTGLHRMLTDIQSAQILRDIVEIKKDTQDEYLAQEMFDYYCEINRVDKNNIPLAEGAILK